MKPPFKKLSLTLLLAGSSLLSAGTAPELNPLLATAAKETIFKPTETVLELTYHLPLNEHVSIQPDLQYIIDPHFSEENAWVIGARSQLTF